MEVGGGGQEDMAFSDWSEKLEAGTSHWLPAYGFQQPSQLHEALMQHDYEVTQQSYVYLETIVEETSDDLRSESEYSAGGWPDTDSDAGSVIHLPMPPGVARTVGGVAAEWSGSERDLAVPKKRRRRLLYNNDPGVQDDDDEDDGPGLAPLSSRSSSLIAFESLERECQEFRASASSEPFHTPPLPASFSFDSLDTAAWRFSGSPDSLEEAASSLSSTCSSSSHISSSDDDHLPRSFSSRSAGNDSYRSSLKSHRSFDSLVTCQEKSPMLSGEFSQSLNNTFIVVEEEEPSAPARGLYKTVECLNEAGRTESKPAEQKKRGQRSAENLSEDSGFGEHIPRGSLRRASSSGVFTVAEQEAGSLPGIDKEGEEWESQANYSHWQSAPDLLDQCEEKCATEKAVSTTSLLLNAQEEVADLPEYKGLKMNTVSTPNLYGQELDDGEYEMRFGDKPVRTQSFKEVVSSAGELRKSRSKGSNIQITTSFINLNASSSSLQASSKVHFSPVVSEVSFKERQSVEEEPPKKVGPAPAKVVESSGGRIARPVPVEPPARMEPAEGKKNKIGGFFQRFSFRRLSGRDKKKKDKKSGATVNGSSGTAPRPEAPLIEDAIIIPLHGPEEERRAKPPLPPPPPPRKREEPPGGGSAMPTGPREGLLETDLDSVGDERPPKTRSLLDLGGGTVASRPQPAAEKEDNRAKSMEFLLDKQAQFSVKPPENELQKVGERVMSEHELRVQRSLQRLNVPDWFKNSQASTQGFLLKRHSEGGGTTSGWQGLTSKTTSLSSLGSRSPTGNLLSPSPTPSIHTFSRWSTNRLASNPGSTSTSPSGSARSSFNYRQPYLGWRSQERLAHPRTPAERLAAGILPQKQATPPPNVPNLSEVHSSIKEVTSAIVHYVSGANKEDRLSPNPPRHDSGSSRSASPRGSTSKFCWLESSFVGNRPVDVPETPVSLNATPEHGKDLYLDLNSISSPSRQINGMSERERLGSPCSATMEDVLDSLLGLTSRSPSPAHSGSASILLPPLEFANGTRRHSEGCDNSSLQPPHPRSGRRVSFDMAVAEGELVRCRYNKCNKTATIAEAKKTFKTCHNCTHIYCSRECRRAHWEKHRKTCLHSRVGALCRKVMSNIKEDDEALQRVSLVARRGFLERGRGAVKVFFSCTEKAESFVNEGVKCLGDPSYVKWADFQTDEMGKEMHEELIKFCQSYNPDSRFILYVCVCVVSEVPTSGPVKWERELVSRCGKLKLSKSLVPKDAGTASKEPDTLILTSLPGARDAGSRKARQVSFTNIQRHLRQRGISLRRQFPDVYQRLCSYVEGSIERFAPVTIYPRDSASGKNFMCIIMPDAEPEKLDLIPTDTKRVHTIDISTDPDSTV